MGEEVVISSMHEASEKVADAKVADVKSLFDTHVNEGKVVVVVEGYDDIKLYEKVMDVEAVCFYADCNCEKHFVILDALNGRYASRMVAIKDADFDRLEGKQHPYPNMFLTDTHDMEGMIVEECLQKLQGEDAMRCQNVDLEVIYAELEDVSYLKWFNHSNHCGINFSETTLVLNMTAYFSAAVTRTNNTVTVTLEDMYAFKESHQGVSEKELCNGHDIFERIYMRAKLANIANYAKKPFFRRLRQAYPKGAFANTSLFKAIRSWELDNHRQILDVA